MNVTVCIWRSEDNTVASPPSFMWIPGIKLRSPSFHGKGFPCDDYSPSELNAQAPPIVKMYTYRGPAASTLLEPTKKDTKCIRATVLSRSLCLMLVDGISQDPVI